MITHAAPQKHYTVLLSRPVLAYIFIRDANLAHFILILNYRKANTSGMKVSGRKQSGKKVYAVVYTLPRKGQE